jgi:hypothetical protein
MLPSSYAHHLCLAVQAFRSQSQRGFDGKVRIVTLTARRCSRLRLPT